MAKDMGMDGLDELMRELSSTSSKSNKSSSKSQTSPTTAAQKSAASATQAATNRGGKTAGKGKAKIIDGFDEDGEFVGVDDTSLPPRVQQFVTRLRDFQMRVADPATREKINDRLKTNHANFAATVKYYEGKPQLGQYTVTTELSRMAYSIVPPNGAALSTPKDIEAIRKLFADMTTQPELEADMMLWRLANQSLLADLLQVLQDCFGKPQDVELCIAIHNTISSFCIDFSTGRLQAESQFAIATVGVRDAPMLTLAHLTGVIMIDVRKKTVEQRVKDLKLRMVFDDDLEAAARSLADGEAASGMERHGEGRPSVAALRDGLLLTVGSAGSAAASTAGAVGTGLFSGVMSLSGGVLSGISSIVLGGDEEAGPPKLYNRDT